MKLLVTGGTGYIGSHICVELLHQGHQVIIIDNLCNSNPIVLKQITEITGKKIEISESEIYDNVFYNNDIRDRKALQQIFQTNNIDAVIHLAGFKAVDESVNKPLKYYDNNITGSIVLFEELAKAGIKTLIYSSSATVYGHPATLPIKEDFPTGCVTNPYARSKLIIEEILQDIYKSDPCWKIGLLRYFNPVGAHYSGIIGESPKGTPNNLMPYISQVAVGKLKKLKIFGDNYPTKDGTCMRDYIHVVDLAKGHLAALNYLNTQDSTLDIFNLGTGRGHSVLEMVHAFEQVCGKSIPYEIIGRRSGDIAECWASVEHAKEILGWESKYNINNMCEDTWRWQQQNPEGYS